VATREEIITSIKTAQIELENAVEQLGKLPAIDAAAVRYVAHSLNSYLTVTAGCVELLLMHLGADGDPDVQGWLRGLKHATGLMAATVNQLLNASVGGEGAKFLHERVNLAKLVRRACDYFQRILADRKKIRVTCRSQVEAACVWADAVAVAAVLDNLLSNAVKFSPPGKEVWVDIAEEPGFVVCTVRDEGPGLSREDRRQLFNRGCRLSNRPTGGEPSLGFGLAVAKDLIDKLGGTIWCESEPGRGAAFSFKLFACEEEPKGQPPSVDKS
jgi:signal transduction histidine kinase